MTDSEPTDGLGPYEAVCAHPAGQTTAARQAKTATEYGFDGVVIRTREAAYDAETLAQKYGIDVVRGIEVEASDPETASGAVGNHRTECTVLCVRGGTPAINRFAVEQDRVDVLTRPLRADGDVNHVIVKQAIEHNVRLEFDLGPVLRRDGGERVRYLRKLKKLREVVDYYDAPYVVSATPDSHLELRAPRELAAVGGAIGFEDGAIEQGLAEWGRVAARNRARRSESFISPGVELEDKR
ncbi:Ribonuclease P protein component 3 [halophilic archaeon DL31]|nr:Ribonuclease P protein component 3 [halophilic archaeon DL31]